LCKHVDETEMRRTKDVTALEKRLKESSGMTDSERRSLVMQISAVQTELKQSLESRCVNKLSLPFNECEKSEKIR